MSNTNFYDLLDTYADASPEDIRKAYRKKALQTHPDRLPQGATNAEKEAAAERFRQVNNAYEILIDSKNRKLYDLYGVWPPPETLPDGYKWQRGDRYKQSSSSRPPNTGPFDSRFDHFPPPRDPFSHHLPRHTFAFTDPFELFNSIFADMQQDAFGSASMFRSPHIHTFASPPFVRFPPPPIGFNPFFPPTVIPDYPDSHAFDRRGIASRRNGAQVFSYQSSSRYGPHPDGQDPRWVSQSTITRTINGVTQTVHKKVDSQGNEHVTKVYPDGREKYTLNGVEQPQSSRHLRDGQSSGYLPPSQYPNYDNDSPVIPPEPEEAGSSKKRWWDPR
ncbi:DnaJ-domain-containing protein [Ramaria rubella]|nr:DnaJ-domain-containing protein [Ramaria rubella]